MSGQANVQQFSKQLIQILSMRGSYFHTLAQQIVLKMTDFPRSSGKNFSSFYLEKGPIGKGGKQKPRLAMRMANMGLRCLTIIYKTNINWLI